MKPTHFLFVVTALTLLGLGNGCSSDATKPVAPGETRELLASSASVSDWQVISHFGADSIPTLSVVTVGEAGAHVALFSPVRYDLTEYDALLVTFVVDLVIPENVNASARIGYAIGENDPHFPNLIYAFLPSTEVLSFGGDHVRFVCSEARVLTAGMKDVFLAFDFGMTRFEGAGPDTSSVTIKTFEIYGVHR